MLISSISGVLSVVHVSQIFGQKLTVYTNDLHLCPAYRSLTLSSVPA